jgi:hypothetical protein
MMAEVEPDPEVIADLELDAATEAQVASGHALGRDCIVGRSAERAEAGGQESLGPMPPETGVANPSRV